MKPFKFFFALSLGVFLFFFIARFVVMAAIAAAVLSFAFFLGRKIKNFFRYLTWEGSYRPDFEDRFDSAYQRSPQIAAWKDESFSDFSKKNRTYSSHYKVIKIQ
ncbi:MAG: hypothetical protein R3E32_18160 [Chitinophagales bacterium]